MAYCYHNVYKLLKVLFLTVVVLDRSNKQLCIRLNCVETLQVSAVKTYMWHTIKLARFVPWRIQMYSISLNFQTFSALYMILPTKIAPMSQKGLNKERGVTVPTNLQQSYSVNSMEDVRTKESNHVFMLLKIT